MTVHMVLIITCKRLKYCVIYCLGGDYFINCHFLPFFLSFGASFALLPSAKLKTQHWASQGSLKELAQLVHGCGATLGPLERTALLHAVACSGHLGLQAIAVHAHDSSSPQWPSATISPLSGGGEVGLGPKVMQEQARCSELPGRVVMLGHWALPPSWGWWEGSAHCVGSIGACGRPQQGCMVVFQEGFGIILGGCHCWSLPAPVAEQIPSEKWSDYPYYPIAWAIQLFCLPQIQGQREVISLWQLGGMVQVQIQH